MRGLATWLIVLASVTGCAKQPGITQASAPAPTGVATASRAPDVGAPPASGGSLRTTGSTPSRAATTTSIATARPQPAGYAEHAALADIHFDFDRYELRETDRRILDAHAAWLKDRADTLLLVEGHCDERGTAEYNISLGERRAKVTANYLTSRGVASDRITIISYGEQRPVCRENGDACWSRNRRAHFLLKQR
jgi:peptidoglycan-associated lipoprotein